MSFLFIMLVALDPAFADDFTGQFVEPTQTAVVYYEEKHCKEVGGDWDNELCFLDSENTIAIQKTNNQYSFKVETIGTNAHSCEAQGIATKVSDSELLSTLDVEIYDWDLKKVVPAKCEISIKYLSKDSVSVNSTEPCRFFCGARAWIEIYRADRQ